MGIIVCRGCLPTIAEAIASAGGWRNYNMKYFYTYAIQSQINGDIYVGWTDDLRQRLHRHNSGQVTATMPGRPWVLVYFEGCLSKEKAIEREKTLKTGFGRKYIKTRI